MNHTSGLDAVAIVLCIVTKSSSTYQLTSQYLLTNAKPTYRRKGLYCYLLSSSSKSPKILDEIVHNAVNLFDECEPVTLFKEEVKFFDEQADAIIKAALSVDTTPERERAKRLIIEDEIEENKEEIEEEETDEEDDHLLKELRRAIKTSEVTGCIIKNRVGSLEKEKLVDMFKEGMNIHLRILSSFFEIIKSEDAQQDLIDLT